MGHSPNRWRRACGATTLAIVLSVVSPRNTDAQPADPPPAVTVAPAATACFSDLVYFTGTVVPREEVLVMPEVEGARVAEVLVEEGDRVRSGQVLARLTRQAPGGAQAQRIDVTAPADGLIVRRGARVGAIVSAASPEPLFRLARGTEIEVEAELPEFRLAKVAADQTVRVQRPAGGDVTGRVRFVAPEIDRQTRLGRARIALPADARLRFGSTVMGAIETARSCGISVPVTALINRGETSFVQRVRDGTVEMRSVRLGLVEGDRAEIREGLAEGDLVVTRAGPFLRDGDAVRPVTAPTAAAGEELRR
jgi:HlyD family secretion protein